MPHLLHLYVLMCLFAFNNLPMVFSVSKEILRLKFLKQFSNKFGLFSPHM